MVAVVAPNATTWLFGHLGDGNIHVNVTGAPPSAATTAPVDAAVLGARRGRGGSISAEHGIGTAKRAWLVRNRSAGEVAAMRAIKGALDPDGICNPNVLLPGARRAQVRRLSPALSILPVPTLGSSSSDDHGLGRLEVGEPLAHPVDELALVGRAR